MSAYEVWTTIIVVLMYSGMVYAVYGVANSATFRDTTAFGTPTRRYLCAIFWPITFIVMIIRGFVDQLVGLIKK